MRTALVDPVTPTWIEHAVEEIWNGDVLEQRYDFIDYHFECAAAYCRARAYLDDMNAVTLFGPFERRGSIVRVAAPEIEAAVLAYLRRRFPKIKRR